MVHTLLKGKKVVLASASPRRVKIFKMLGINALKMPSHVDENNDWKNPGKFVIQAAKLKAQSIARVMDQDCIIVAADTIVFLGDTILGKPNDKDDAARYLQLLSGNTHTVYTGICLISGPGQHRIVSDYEKTKVTFKKLSNKEIEDYIETGEPMDKAGAYGIQGYGSQFVEKISGCYFNVMGFPVPLFYKLLEKL